MRSTSSRRRLRRAALVSPVGVALAAVLAGWPLAGCDRPDGDGAASPGTAASDSPWFEDVTEKLGVSFVHRIGPPGRFFMPEVVGSGCALFDCDNDGRLDLLLLHNAGPGSGVKHQLFRQAGDGRFSDVSAGSGLDVDGFAMGAAAGDVNNDGLPDVCVTQYPTGGASGARLFLNLGDGKFREITTPCGIHDPHWGTSAAFVDYDRDGWLDLVVANYVDYSDSIQCADPAGRPDYCGPSGFRGTASRLYRNLGPQAQAGGVPRFRDVTGPSGLGAAPGPALGVVCADFDGDGWQDLFIANDGKPNHLWVNRRDGTFAEEGAARGAAYNRMGQAEANMGIGLADVNADGLFDLFVTHLTEETHTLWAQGPRGYFQDRTPRSGLTGGQWRGTGFGTVLADFNNDGAADAALANGRVRRTKLPAPLSTKHDPAPAAAATANAHAPSDPWADYRERNQLFANDGSGRFRDVSAANPALSGAPAVARGMAAGDLDNDGALDLVITSIEGPVRVLRNRTAPSAGGAAAAAKAHWLTVRAVDPAAGGRDAYGAEVTVRAAGRVHSAWMNPGSSYLCSNDPRAHVGLGGAAAVEWVRVKWPDGTEEEFPGGPADRLVVLSKGAGRARPAGPASQPAEPAPQ